MADMAVEMIDYDPQWQDRFNEQRDLLSTAAGWPGR